MLNETQRQQVDKLNNEKDTLIQNRLWNKSELKRIKAWLDIEEGVTGQEREDRWELRCNLRESVRLAKEGIDKQTTDIKCLSIPSIAIKIDADEDAVRYHLKSSINPRALKTAENKALRGKKMDEKKLTQGLSPEQRNKMQGAIERSRGRDKESVLFCGEV